MENLEDLENIEIENTITENELELTPQVQETLNERLKEVENGNFYPSNELKEKVFETKKKANAIWCNKELKEQFHKQRKEAKKKTNSYLQHLLELGQSFDKIEAEQI